MKQGYDVFLVCSCGGHLTQILKLNEAYKDYSHLFILSGRYDPVDEMRDRAVQITHSERDFKFFINLIEMYRLFKKHKPKVVISTGASPAVAAVAMRLLFRFKFIYIESISRVATLSLTGRIMYQLSDYFFVQWPKLTEKYPRALFKGNIL